MEYDVLPGQMGMISIHVPREGDDSAYDLQRWCFT